MIIYLLLLLKKKKKNLDEASIELFVPFILSGAGLRPNNSIMTGSSGKGYSYMGWQCIQGIS